MARSARCQVEVQRGERVYRCRNKADRVCPLWTDVEQWVLVKLCRKHGTSMGVKGPTPGVNSQGKEESSE